MRVQRVAASCALAALGTTGGAVAAATSAILSAHAAAADSIECNYNYDEGADNLPSPQVFEFFNSDDQLVGNMQDSLDFDCDPQTEPPFAATATGSSLWKAISGNWYEQDPASGSNGGLGIWSASSDDSAYCGTECVDGSVWKQVWNADSLLDPDFEWTYVSGACVGMDTSLLSCSGANYGPNDVNY